MLARVLATAFVSLITIAAFASTPEPPTQWIVQLGTFRSRENAEALAARAAAIKERVQVIHARSLYVVQAGPFPTRNDAVRVQQSLLRLPVESIIARRQLPPAEEEDTENAMVALPRVLPATRSKEEYFVQVGVYRLAEHATEMLDRLTAQGYSGESIQNGSRLTVVRLGPYQVRTDVDAVVADLHKRGIETALFTADGALIRE